MGFEPTISTLGKLHVDPYTKPARTFPTPPSIIGAGAIVKSLILPGVRVKILRAGERHSDGRDERRERASPKQDEEGKERQ